jgi:hypothetical protein
MAESCGSPPCNLTLDFRIALKLRHESSGTPATGNAVRVLSLHPAGAEGRSQLHDHGQLECMAALCEFVIPKEAAGSVSVPHKRFPGMSQQQRRVGREIDCRTQRRMASLSADDHGSLSSRTRCFHACSGSLTARGSVPPRALPSGANCFRKTLNCYA